MRKVTITFNQVVVDARNGIFSTEVVYTTSGKMMYSGYNGQEYIRTWGWNPGSSMIIGRIPACLSYQEEREMREVYSQISFDEAWELHRLV